MAPPRVNGWLLGLGAALAGAWWFLRRTPPMSQAQAIQTATAYANEFLALQRSRGFTANMIGFEKAIYGVGQPPLLTWPWTYGDEPNWWVQFGVDYIDPFFGAFSNLIVVVNVYSGGIVVTDITNIDVTNYFQIGPPAPGRVFG